MMHQHDQNQRFVFIEATKLAANGDEFSHLVKLLDPEYALRLRIYVQQMPLDIARKTIYGRSVTHKLKK